MIHFSFQRIFLIKLENYIDILMTGIVSSVHGDTTNEPIFLMGTHDFLAEEKTVGASYC
jgi:hypothetical protein